jgi:hypothetical protein
MTPSEQQTELSEQQAVRAIIDTLIVWDGSKIGATPKTFEVLAELRRHRQLAAAGDDRERARDCLAPYFATDGEEEDPRIAEAVEGVLGRILEALALVRADQREKDARIAESIRPPSYANPQLAWNVARDIAEMIRAGDMPPNKGFPSEVNCGACGRRLPAAIRGGENG